MSHWHVALDASTWRSAPVIVGSTSDPVALRMIDLETSMVIAAHARRWTTNVTPWMHVRLDNPASLVAREIATLSWITPIGAVVMSSDDDDVSAHAQIVAALLVDDDVTLTNSVAQLTGAFNRPLPPSPIEIWTTADSWWDDEVRLTQFSLDGSTGVVAVSNTLPLSNGVDSAR